MMITIAVHVHDDTEITPYLHSDLQGPWGAIAIREAPQALNIFIRNADDAKRLISAAERVLAHMETGEQQ